MTLALGPVTRLMTRSLYALLDTRASCCDRLEITPEAKTELQFWKQGMERFNGQDIWHSPSALRVVDTDASDTGYGGYTVEHGCYIAHGQWTPSESKQSSKWHELRAVSLVLESLVSKLANERVRWFTDNQNVARIMAVGSKSALLQKEAFAIFSCSIANKIRIEPEWIPRDGNQQADYLSRIVDYDDWQIHPRIFAELDGNWGPHAIDRFASFYNAQLPRFNSRFWNPGTEAVDAFTCNWQERINWWCPPPYLVPWTIQHALRTRARGTLVVPQWPSAVFWLMLFPDGCTIAWFIQEVRVLDKTNMVICLGKRGSNLFGSTPNTNLLAIRLDFRSQEG